MPLETKESHQNVDSGKYFEMRFSRLRLLVKIQNIQEANHTTLLTNENHQDILYITREK